MGVYTGLTPRGKAMRHLSRRRGITERPPGSNTDDRRYGIRTAQRLCAGGGSWLIGLAWCGCWAFYALWQAGVRGISYRQASVALIEDDARRGDGPFRKWVGRESWSHVLRGDLVVLFGRGVHVETVRAFVRRGGQRYVITDGGNTSPQPGSGSESDGGGAFRRVRPLSDVHGFAIVDYPGGPRRLDRAAMQAEAIRHRLTPRRRQPPVLLTASSDQRLLAQLEQRAKTHPLGGQEGALRAELAAALHHQPGSNR